MYVCSNFNFVDDVSLVLKREAHTRDELTRKFDELDEIFKKVCVQIQDPVLQFKLLNLKNRLIVLIHNKRDPNNPEWDICRKELFSLSKNVQEVVKLRSFSYLFPEGTSLSELRAVTTCLEVMKRRAQRPKPTALDESGLKNAEGDRKTCNFLDLDIEVNAIEPTRHNPNVTVKAAEVERKAKQLDTDLATDFEVGELHESKEHHFSGILASLPPVIENSRIWSDLPSNFCTLESIVAQNLVIFKPWWRLYHHTLKLLSEPEQLPSAAAFALRFFLINYLARSAPMNAVQARWLGCSISPLQLQTFYHRDNQPKNMHLTILNFTILKRFQLVVGKEVALSLSDLEGFNRMFQQQKVTVKLALTDNDDTIQQKIALAEEERKKTGAKVLYVLLEKSVELSVGDVEEWRQFATKVKVLTLKTEHVQIVGIGQSLGQQFVIHFDGTAESENELRLMISNFGYVPSSSQVAHQLAKAPEFNLSILQAELKEQYNPLETDLRLGKLFVRSLDELLQNATLKQLKRCAAMHPNSPVGIVSENIVKAIKGLKEYPVDASFAQMGLRTVLHECYARMLNLMEVMMRQDYKNGGEKALVKLADLKDLIFEDLFFIIEVSADKSQANQRVEELLMKPLKNAVMKPTACSFVNNGVRCVTLLHRVCQKAKELETKEGATLSILSYQDSYYEIADPKRYGRQRVVTVAAPDYDKSLDEALTKFSQLPDSEKIDFIVVDPHGSLNKDSRSIDTHDAGKIIDAVLARNASRRPLTVALDTTIAFIEDPETVRLLAKYQKLIEDGQLNLVFYRSIHKFDAFGTDKLTGGVLQVYSKNPNFLQSFASTMGEQKGYVDPINPLCFVHLQKYCHAGLEEWRRRIFENTSYLYSLIDKRFVSSDPAAKDLPFYMYELKDSINFATVLYVSNREEYAKFEQILKYKGFPCVSRLGFGFLYTTDCSFYANKENQYIRFNIGIEDKAKFKIFAEIFNAFLNEYKMRAKQLFRSL